MKSIVRARAPLRLGFAGGGTDVSPYCDLYGGAIVNVTIGRYAQATITLHDEPRLCFAELDLGLSEALPLAAELPMDGGLVIHRAGYRPVPSSPCRLSGHSGTPGSRASRAAGRTSTQPRSAG